MQLVQFLKFFICIARVQIEFRKVFFQLAVDIKGLLYVKSKLFCEECSNSVCDVRKVIKPPEKGCGA